MTQLVMSLDDAIDAIDSGMLNLIDLKNHYPEFYQNNLVTITALEKNPDIITEIYPEFLDDQEVMFYAVKKKGKNLRYVSRRLKGDPFVVSAAVKNDGLAFIYADEKLRASEKLAIDAFKQNDFSYAYFDESLLKKQSLYAKLGKYAGLHFLTIIDDDTVQDTPKFLILLDALINNGNFVPTSDYEVEEALKIVLTNKEIKKLLDANPDLILTDIVNLLKSKYEEGESMLPKVSGH